MSATAIPREMSRQLEWLDRANRLTLAAQEMAQRSSRYLDLANMVQPQRRQYWRDRAWRATRAAGRMLLGSERLLGKALPKGGRPC